MDKRIFHIVQQLEACLDRNWTVEMMADEASLSVSHFQKAFRERKGETPMAYLVERRLIKAHNLLTDPKCFSLIKEIASQCGFADESNFTRCFKRKYGMTPTQCVEQAAEKHQSVPPNEQQ